MAQQIPHIVFDGKGQLTTLSFVQWREVNIGPHSKLRPVYEWKLFSDNFVITARWKLSLPTDPIAEVMVEPAVAKGDQILEDFAVEATSGKVHALFRFISEQKGETWPIDVLRRYAHVPNGDY